MGATRASKARPPRAPNFAEQSAAGGLERARTSLKLGPAAAIERTGRKTAVLAGFETDVCVTHSAVGLSEAGYRVVVADAAVCSPAGAQAYGLARLRDLGVELVRSKGIYCDWVRTLEARSPFGTRTPSSASRRGSGSERSRAPGCGRDGDAVTQSGYRLSTMNRNRRS